MIKKATSQTAASMKAIRDKEKATKEEAIRLQCKKIADEKYGEDQMKRWSNQHGGLWFLPVLDEEGESVQKLAIFKPIDRHILSFASTKLQDEGLYVFVEACMRECWVAGDEEIIEDDEYFLSAAMKFNSIIDSKKVALLKR